MTRAPTLGVTAMGILNVNADSFSDPRPRGDLLGRRARELEQLLPVVAGLTTLARRFRDATGTTPMRWLTHQRVTRAQQLLATTDLPVEAIAHRDGLGTATDLRQYFRAATGMAPVTYRRRYPHQPPTDAHSDGLGQHGTRSAAPRLDLPNGQRHQPAGG